MPRSLPRAIVASVLAPIALATLPALSASLFEAKRTGNSVRPDERTPSTQAEQPGELLIPQTVHAAQSRRQPPIAARSQRILVEHALGELSRELGREGITRSEWERTLRAIAGGLGPETRTVLPEICAEQRGREERIAAFELARLQGRSNPEAVVVLPSSQLTWLAELLRHDELPPALEAAACRSMVAFGGRADRLALVDRLRSSANEQAGTAAAWGLAAARDETTIVAIAEAMSADINGRCSDLAAATIGEILHSADPASLGPRVTATLEQRLVSMLEDRNSAAGLRRRAVLALERLGGGRARATFSLLLELGEEDPELARLASQAMARMDGGASSNLFVGAMLDPSLEGETGFLAAEALAIAHATDPAARDLAAERMRRAAANDPHPSKRRRALLALAQSGATSALPTIADCIRSDEDATVRAAAIVALEQLDVRGAFDDVLESRLALDSSQNVRALALQALK